MNESEELIKENIERLRKILKNETGINLDNYKNTFLKRRFLPRAFALGFTTLDSYIDFLTKNRKEREKAKSKIFVPTTEFFRNTEVFEAVKNFAVSNFQGIERIKIASAPCSTGEEAFSLAIIMEEIGKEYEIFAIDGNITALKAIKSKKFTAKNLLPLYKNQIKRYFNEEGNLFSLKEEILERVFPVQADLIESLPIHSLDIVFMRNFFIYLKEEALKKCIQNVERSLKKGGLLVLGKVERVELESTLWKTVNQSLKIFLFKGERK